MKSFEQIAQAMYKKWQAALARFRKPKPFAELEEHQIGRYHTAREAIDAAIAAAK